MRQKTLNIRPLLNAEKLCVADSILNVVTQNYNVANILFLDGPGVTCKTFTYNYIGKLLQEICAALLQNGKIVHSLFKLPVPVLDGCTYNIKPNSDLAAF